MSKIRVHELAKELNISSKELITVLESEFSIVVKNHMSIIEEEDAELIKELLKDNAEEILAKINSNSPVVEYEEILDKEAQKTRKNKNKNKRQFEDDNSSDEDDVEEAKIVEISESINVKDFADKLGKPVTEVIRQCIFCGIMASINADLDYKTAEKVASKFNVVLEKVANEEAEEDDIEIEDDNQETTIKRPPVVTVMGHVDHGKTSLLDAIRKAKVTENEAGGITQHIGAYTVTLNDEKITFLDTPGHEAFTAMRARGAQITDVVILVVAADDGIMPQTAEAINHCKAANVPMIVAINKMDKPDATPDRVKQELTEYGMVAEDWGGDTVCVPVSAKTKMGIDELLEMVVLSSEILELKADPNRKARGTVIESKLDKGRGAVATLLIQNGTLNVGDSIIVGSTYGRIRAMFDDKGKKIKSAGPSTPVEILGLSEVPAAGDRFNVVKDEKTARNMAESRKQKIKETIQQDAHRVSLEGLYSQIQEGKVKELNVIIKADVQGSIEAIKQAIAKLSTDDVKTRILHGAVGAITETDITLAAASNAVVIGFNVRPDANASVIADRDGVEIKTYRVIYDAVEDIKSALIGMLDPLYKEVITGKAEVRQTLKISNVGTIAGSYILDGKIGRHNKVRVIRNGIVIFESKFSSLKRFKDDVKEVAAGYECGITVENFNDVKEGDIIEAFIIEEIKRKEL